MLFGLTRVEPTHRGSCVPAPRILVSQDDFTHSDAGPLSRKTLAHYEGRADAFREGTWDHDVSQNIDTLLRFIEAEPPARILDLGCGPGRDLVALRDLGHEAVGLDGAESFCRMAREISGQEVLHQDFLALDLPDASFDGIFANASLFHVPLCELERVLVELRASLKPRGVLFASIPHGPDIERFDGHRYGAYHTPDTWCRLLAAAGFVELCQYYRPDGMPREQQPWFASAWRKA